MKTVTAQDWRAQAREAYSELSRVNERDGGQLTFLGYSLGGVLVMDLLANTPGLRVDRTVLFAPALKVRIPDFLMNAGNSLDAGFSIPSMAPVNYRAQESTSLAAYRSLSDLVVSFNAADILAVNVPTVVFIDKNDELVSYGKLKRLVEGLDHWELVTVDNRDSTLRPRYNHLIIDPLAVGEKEWEKKVRPGLDKILGPVNDASAP
jgi:pimeloyl-ACP methyl ester carboxylesterase